MAIWQFSLHLIPRATLVKRYGAVPARVAEDDWWSVETDWWEERLPAAGFAAILDEVLPRMTGHWSKATRAWGGYESHIVEVSYDGPNLESFQVRIDVRGPEAAYLHAICKVAAMSDCCLMTEDRMVIEPRVELLLAEMRQSSSFRFVTDPEGFLASFKGMPRLW